ncbi:MAG: GNAT family N-acetyltransferase [Oscillospiraceae bacterium]|nr:GNAT family N-acetyltransferase [Oscillospiraceae bacterium]
MQKTDYKRYSDFIHYAANNDCGKVYPLSVSQGFQHGDIFTYSANNCEAVLFWHYCGFAYLAGKPDETFLEDVYKLMLNRDSTNSRRFILMTNNKDTEKFFRSKDGVCIDRRYLFEYTENQSPVIPIMPSGFEIKEINSELLSAIHGGIVPSLFWEKSENFLKKGKGYCILDGKNVAAWAFSAAVSSSEIDIGVETAENYRGRGLASVAAKMMIKYAFDVRKSPVWACHCNNDASKRLAEKIGFIKTSECSIIKSK